MNRVDSFYQNAFFQKMNGLPEKLIEKEEELQESLGDYLLVSKKEYEDGKIILGKVNKWFFLGNEKGEYQVFEDKMLFLLFIKNEFEKASLNSKENLDPSWKGFWARELETL